MLSLSPPFSKGLWVIQAAIKIFWWEFTLMWTAVHIFCIFDIGMQEGYREALSTTMCWNIFPVQAEISRLVFTWKKYSFQWHPPNVVDKKVETKIVYRKRSAAATQGRMDKVITNEPFQEPLSMVRRSDHHGLGATFGSGILPKISRRYFQRNRHCKPSPRNLGIKKFGRGSSRSMAK